MHFEYFKQLFTVLTFCRCVSYSADKIYLDPIGFKELKKNLHDFRLKSQHVASDYQHKILPVEYETFLQKVRIVKSCEKCSKCIDLVI